MLRSVSVRGHLLWVAVLLIQHIDSRIRVCLKGALMLIHSSFCANGRAANYRLQWSATLIRVNQGLVIKR